MQCTLVLYRIMPDACQSDGVQTASFILVLEQIMRVLCYRFILNLAW